MAWTYSNDPANVPRDAVRFLVGDTDTSDQKVTDEEISFALLEANEDVYAGAAICARALSAKYARRVDVEFDGVSHKYSQLSKSYMDLARKLENQSKAMGGNSAIGAPLAGGIRISDMESANEDDDRVKPAFNTGQFRNPPGYTDQTDVEWN